MITPTQVDSALKSAGFDILEARDAALDPNPGGIPWFQPLTPSWNVLTQRFQFTWLGMRTTKAALWAMEMVSFFSVFFFWYPFVSFLLLVYFVFFSLLSCLPFLSCLCSVLFPCTYAPFYVRFLLKLLLLHCWSTTLFFSRVVNMRRGTDSPDGEN